MASTGLLPASLLVPPSDPVDRRDWYATVEEQIARDVRTNLRRIITDAFTAYLDTLTASGDETALDAIIEDWATYVTTELGPTYQGLYLGSSVAAWTTSPATAALPLAALEGWSKVVNYSAIDYQMTATNRLAQVGDNVWSAVNTKVLGALESGASNEQLKQMIEDLTQFSEFRADTIARTETASAMNNGRYDAAVALGEYGPVAKVWNAVVDNRSRLSHAELDGTTIPFDQNFVVNGESMRAPHAPGASAANTVNCRCGIIELFEGMIDPNGNIWTAEGPTTATEAQRQEQAYMLRENRQRMSQPEVTRPEIKALIDGWAVTAT